MDVECRCQRTVSRHISENFSVEHTDAYLEKKTFVTIIITGELYTDMIPSYAQQFSSCFPRLLRAIRLSNKQSQYTGNQISGHHT